MLYISTSPVVSHSAVSMPVLPVGPKYIFRKFFRGKEAAVVPLPIISICVSLNLIWLKDVSAISVVLASVFSTTRYSMPSADTGAANREVTAMMRILKVFIIDGV